MRLRKVAAVCAITVALLAGPLAGVALAHVEVSATPAATQGGAAALSFEVPSEKDLPTIAVEIALPADTPILDVTIPPIDGWTLSLLTAPAPAGLTGTDGQPVTEVVTAVVWTAIGVGIAPEQSVDFVIDAGRLPAVDRISFPVAQTYSDGSVVSWAQQSADGAGEPDFPAPVLFLAPGAAQPVVPPTPVASSAAPAVETTETPVTAAPTVPTPSSSDPAGTSPAASEQTTPATTDQAAKSTDGSNLTAIVVVSVIGAALLAGAGYAIVRRRQHSW